MAISHCYWCLVVKNGNFTLLLTSSGQDEFKLGRSTPRSAGRSTPQHWHLLVKMSSNLASNLADQPLDLLVDLFPQYWHLVVQNGNFTLLLTCLVVKNGNFTLLLTCLVVRNGNFTLLLISRGQEWQSHIDYWHLVVKMSSNLWIYP